MDDTTQKTVQLVKPEGTHRFFLKNILTARIALDLETGCHGDDDQDTNVYLAGLFESLIKAQSFAAGRPYVSPYDSDILGYLEEHPGPRNEYVVYKDNADYGLMSAGVFSGHHHGGSYHGRVVGDADEAPRIAFYYRLAAGSLEHLRGARAALVHTFGALSNHMKDFVRIVSKVASDYFSFIEHISSGSLYHLQRDILAMSRMEAYQEKLDEFLDLYGRFKESPSIELKDALLRCSEELKLLNPDFSFDEQSV